jgi:hypothetical protein
MARFGQLEELVAGSLFRDDGIVRNAAGFSLLRTQNQLTLQTFPCITDTCVRFSFSLLHVPAPIKKLLYVFNQEKGFAI